MVTKTLRALQLLIRMGSRETYNAVFNSTDGTRLNDTAIIEITVFPSTTGNLSTC